MTFSSENFRLVVDDLMRISWQPYKKHDSKKNHQTFARALLYLMLKLEHNDS